MLALALAQTYPKEALELCVGLLTRFIPSMCHDMPIPHTHESSPGASPPTPTTLDASCSVYSPHHTHLDLASASGHSQVEPCPGKHLLILRGVPELMPRGLCHPLDSSLPFLG